MVVYREREKLGPKDENGELRSWRFLFIFDEQGWKEIEPSRVTKTTRYLGFLTEAFQPRAFWFIIFENFRRLMLSSVLITFAAASNDTGTAAQAIAALLICVFSIKVYQYCTLLLPFLHFCLRFIDLIQMIRRPLLLHLVCCRLTFREQDGRPIYRTFTVGKFVFVYRNRCW